MSARRYRTVSSLRIPELMDKAHLSVQRLYAAERRDAADAMEDRTGYVPWLLLGQVHTLVCMDAQQDLNAVFGCA